jgi:hypothetical protein
MSHYASLIDPTNFGTVARYLHHPQAPIHFVLHVKETSMLADLAAKLDAAMAGAQGRPVALGPILNPLFEDGSLRISSRHEFRASDPRHVVPVTSIPSLASCQVIYLPPFYLVHTPGLFEGTLVKPEARLRQGPAQRMKL